MTLHTKKVTPSSSSASTVTNYTLHLEDDVAYSNDGNKLHASTTRRQITRFNSKTTLPIATTVTNCTHQLHHNVTYSNNGNKSHPSTPRRYPQNNMNGNKSHASTPRQLFPITNCTPEFQDGVNYQSKASRCFTPSQPVLLYQGELPAKRVTPCPVQKQQYQSTRTLRLQDDITYSNNGNT